MLPISSLLAARCKPLHTALALLLFFVLSLADPPAYGPRNAHAYDIGKFGRYPQISFKTTRFTSAHFLLRQWAQSCYDDDEYFYFIAPYAAGYHKDQGPMIVDSNGQLVWHQEFPVRTFGLMVQQYKGQDYLTWWTGDDRVAGHGHGFGSYYMLDNTYMPYKKLGAYNDMPGDLHEFHITKWNTVLISSYPKTKFDLSAFGRKNGYVWDGAFQEFDFDTNELLFQWRASEHYNLHSSWEELGGKGTRKHPWDFFHINSVDKDDKGNYLLSGRHSAISYIDGKTGEYIWHLGGPENSFKDRSGSGGRALSFKWQHHARWTEDYTAITLFDNHRRGGEEPSRGLKIYLDQEKMIITRLEEFIHPQGFAGHWMGSFQTLDNGNYLIGYGRGAAATEFSPNGSVVCDLGYAPLRLTPKHKIRYGVSQSYRTFKLRWKATPYYDPDVFLDRNTDHLYVSWNGATDVRSWGLEGSHLPGDWHNIREIPKSGFESNFTVKISKWENFRLTAYDKTHKTIRAWLISNKGVIQVERFSTTTAHNDSIAIHTSAEPSQPTTTSISTSSKSSSPKSTSSKQTPTRPTPSTPSHPKPNHSKPAHPNHPKPNHSKPKQSKIEQLISDNSTPIFASISVAVIALVLFIATRSFSRTFFSSVLHRRRKSQDPPGEDTYFEEEGLLTSQIDNGQETLVSNAYTDDHKQAAVQDDLPASPTSSSEDTLAGNAEKADNTSSPAPYHDR